MSNINLPDPIDPYSKYKVEKISKDSQKNNNLPKRPKKNYVKEAFINAWQKFLKNFNSLKKRASSNQPIQKDLIDLKNLFIKLTEDNLSRDLTYLNELAFKWLDILDSYDYIPTNNKKKLTEIKDFFDDVYSYPKGQSYSLGYYLTEHAGYKWIPFPFMEILLTLYIEYQNNPNNCKLTKWINLLSEILQKS